MAKFFVGQRVRIVHAASSQSLIGREARITKWRDDAYGRYGDYCGWQLDVKNDFGRWAVAMEDWIEPIIPDGHRAGVKGECSLLDELLSREVKSDALVPLPQQSET